MVLGAFGCRLGNVNTLLSTTVMLLWLAVIHSGCARLVSSGIGRKGPSDSVITKTVSKMLGSVSAGELKMAS